MKRIYLDNAATTALSPMALEKMMPFLSEVYGNPSSVHTSGREARSAIDQARARVAEILCAHPQEILFTSGGTESDNLALKGAFYACPNRKKHLITTAIEHHAVLHTCAWLEKQGCEVTYLPVNREGKVSPEQVENAITDHTFLISVMTANNEIGTLEPIREIGALARAYGILFHTDAVQAAGFVPLDVNELQADMLSLSAHKFHGPKGVGALYIRRGTRLQPLMHGGVQERSLRPGTENTAGIVGMAYALQEAAEHREENTARVSMLKNRLKDGLLTAVPDVTVNGSQLDTLPNILNLTVKGIDSESLLLRMDLMGVEASGGAACTAGIVQESHVLRAIGLAPDALKSSFRISLSAQTTQEEIDTVLQVLPGLIFDLRSMMEIKHS